MSPCASLAWLGVGPQVQVALGAAGAGRGVVLLECQAGVSYEQNVVSTQEHAESNLCSPVRLKLAARTILRF